MSGKMCVCVCVYATPVARMSWRTQKNIYKNLLQLLFFFYGKIRECFSLKQQKKAKEKKFEKKKNISKHKKQHRKKKHKKNSFTKFSFDQLTVNNFALFFANTHTHTQFMFIFYFLKFFPCCFSQTIESSSSFFQSAFFLILKIVLNIFLRSTKGFLCCGEGVEVVVVCLTKKGGFECCEVHFNDCVEEAKEKTIP